MVKSLALLLALAPQLQAEALHLKGFKLVDPAAESVKEADLYIEGGKVSAGPLKGARVIEGKGRFLMPLLADLKLSCWGNESALDYDVLTQEMDGALSARVQLYYGVGLIVPAHNGFEWMWRFFDRLEKLALDGAEVVRAEGAIKGDSKAAWAGHTVTSTAQLEAALEANARHGARVVEIVYGPKDHKHIPAVSVEILKAAILAAKGRGLPSLVLAGSWEQAVEAARLGAGAIHGLPEGEPSAAQLASLKKSGAVFVPALSGFLDLPWLQDDATRLEDPFLTATVSKAVLDSFRDRAKLWEFWKPVESHGRAQRGPALRWLKRLEKAGVPLASGTDAGWNAGTFQGYSTHRTQEWLEEAGLRPWTRLQAASSAPRKFLGRTQPPFSKGAPADFLALDADPLKAAKNLRQISLIIRAGREVDRERLKPDLSRDRFRRLSAP